MKLEFTVRRQYKIFCGGVVVLELELFWFGSCLELKTFVIGVVILTKLEFAFRKISSLELISGEIFGFVFSR